MGLWLGLGLWLGPLAGSEDLGPYSIYIRAPYQAHPHTRAFRTPYWAHPYKAYKELHTRPTPILAHTRPMGVLQKVGGATHGVGETVHAVGSAEHLGGSAGPMEVLPTSARGTAEPMAGSAGFWAAPPWAASLTPREAPPTPGQLR